MKRSLAAVLILAFATFGCNEEELKNLKAENEALKEQLKQAQLSLDDQKKLTKFAKDEAETAKRRTAEILKDCKK